MKIKKTLAAIAAAAMLTASISAVNASAIDLKYYKNDNNNTVFVNADKENDPNWSADYQADITSVYGVVYTVKLDAKGVAEGGWFGGKLILNSNSNGWKELKTWGNGSEEIFVDTSKDTAEIKYLSDTPFFKADDQYAQVCLQSYGAAITITGVELLDKDGNFINLELPVVTEAAAEETEEGAAEAAEGTTEETAAETEAAEETAAETEAAEETAAETEAVEETAEEADEEETEAAVAVDYSALTGEVITDTEATSAGAWGQAITLTTIKNDNGVFDPAVLTPDKAVVVYYEAETAPEVVLQSWSGGEGWAKVPANEEFSTEGVAVFTYDYMTAMYQSEDFSSTLDAFIVGDTGSELTVSKVLLVDTAALTAGAESDEEVIEDAAPAEEEEVVTEAPAEEEAVTEAPAADTTTPVASTGNTAAASIAAVMALAGAAAVISKRK